MVRYRFNIEPGIIQRLVQYRCRYRIICPSCNIAGMGAQVHVNRVPATLEVRVIFVLLTLLHRDLVRGEVVKGGVGINCHHIILSLVPLQPDAAGVR